MSVIKVKVTVAKNQKLSFRVITSVCCALLTPNLRCSLYQDATQDCNLGVCDQGQGHCCKKNRNSVSAQ